MPTLSTTRTSRHLGPVLPIWPRRVCIIAHRVEEARVPSWPRLRPNINFLLLPYPTSCPCSTCVQTGRNSLAARACRHFLGFLVASPRPHSPPLRSLLCGNNSQTCSRTFCLVLLNIYAHHSFGLILGFLTRRLARSALAVVSLPFCPFVYLDASSPPAPWDRGWKLMTGAWCWSLPLPFSPSNTRMESRTW